jgi:xylose isomerase
MAETIYSSFETVKYECRSKEKALAYRWYDSDRVALAKPFMDHLRFSVAYWHSLAMQDGDPFGPAAMRRPRLAVGGLDTGGRYPDAKVRQCGLRAYKSGRPPPSTSIL